VAAAAGVTDGDLDVDRGARGAELGLEGEHVAGGGVDVDPGAGEGALGGDLDAVDLAAAPLAALRVERIIGPSTAVTSMF
jgi:hypothetical protein